MPVDVATIKFYHIYMCEFTRWDEMQTAVYNVGTFLAEAGPAISEVSEKADALFTRDFPDMILVPTETRMASGRKPLPAGGNAQNMWWRSRVNFSLDIYY